MANGAIRTAATDLDAYRAFEEASDRRHEFVAGAVYAAARSEPSRVEMLSRQGDWVPTVSGIDDTATFGSIGLTAPVAELYEGMDYLA